MSEWTPVSKKPMFAGYYLCTSDELDNSVSGGDGAVLWFDLIDFDQPIRRSGSDTSRKWKVRYWMIIPLIPIKNPVDQEESEL